MRTNSIMATGRIQEHKGFIMIFGSILIGLVLAMFLLISTQAAILGLFCGIVLVLTVLLRKTDYLIYTWFVLTSSLWLILVRLMPSHYFPYIGRGIFWGILVCVIAAWAMDNILMHRQFEPFNNVPLKAIIIIFLLWCMMTLFTSIDILNSVRKLSHIVVALVASYMFYDFFSRDQNNIKKVINIVSLVVTLVSFLTIVLALHALMSGIPIYKQIQIWFLNPNILGLFLMMCSPVLITSGFDFGPIKRLKFLFVSLMLLALFLSFARSSWLGALVSIVFILWKGRMRVPMSLAIVVGLVLVALLFPVVGGDVYDFVTGEQYTGRRIIWQAAFNIARDYPLFGIGLGNCLNVMPGYIEVGYMKHANTHSLYLQNAAEMGFVSWAILLAFFVVFFHSSQKIERNLKSHYLGSAVTGAVATFWGLIVHGIFETGSFLTSFDAAEFHVMLPYILMSLPFAAKKLEERQEEVRPEV